MPSPNLFNPECQACHLTEYAAGRTFQCCSGCRISRYCSKQCQIRDWPDHKATTCRLAKQRRLSTRSAPCLAHGLTLKKADSQLKKWIFANRSLLQNLAAQVLEGQAEIGPGGRQEDRFVVISIAAGVAQSGDSAEPRLQVEVDYIFTVPFSEVKNCYPQVDEITLQSFLEQKRKWRAVGRDCIAIFLEILALNVIQIAPMIV